MLVNGFDIVPASINGSYRTGSLPSNVTLKQLIEVFGFPNCADDPYKVIYSWGFTIDGQQAGIWDYKGTRWSTFGPNDKIRAALGIGGNND